MDPGECVVDAKQINPGDFLLLKSIGFFATVGNESDSTTLTENLDLSKLTLICAMQHGSHASEGLVNAHTPTWGSVGTGVE